jgi:predicted Zn finger-like uncharacterized protein
MSKVQVQCPKCSAPYSIDESLLGKKGRCKKCQTVFRLARGVSPTVKNGVSSIFCWFDPKIERTPLSPRAGGGF